jgi:tRNA (guanine37-N1)-methyltransferase
VHFDILTIFPDMFPGTLGGGVVGRALDRGIWSYNVANLRDFGVGGYKAVDDEQFGGGAGQVLRADVIAKAFDYSKAKSHKPTDRIIYFSPRGKVWNQEMAKQAAANPDGRLTLLCGRYEGVDQRVIEEYEMEEISIGDYILSGGEIAAQVFIDSCVRLLDNVVNGGAESVASESFEIGGLEWPLYTRPSAWRGRNVPEVLLSGHHGNIDAWRREQSQKITQARRPELLKKD